MSSGKSPDAFRTISEVAGELDVPQHVLRFWETKFPQVKPMKRGGGRRYYRPDDVALLRRIRALLYEDGYTIKGVQKVLREHGVKAVIAGAPSSPVAGSAIMAEAVSAPSMRNESKQVQTATLFSDLSSNDDAEMTKELASAVTGELRAVLDDMKRLRALLTGPESDEEKKSV